MADLVRTVGIIFQGDDRVSAVARIAADGIKDVGGAAGAVGAATGQAAAGVDDLNKKTAATNITLREMTQVMTALAGAVVVKEFIAANVAVENFDRAMTVVTGSSKGAGDAMEFVRRTSDILGLEISSTADNFVSLSAAAKGTTLEGQATRDVFEAVSKAMALLGKSSADTQGALLAVQQMISKGTVSSEELRGQLGERLPGAFQIAARAMGVTTIELGDMLKAGAVATDEFLPKFAAELNKTFGDTREVNTFNAELNRLITSLKDLATSGVGDGIFGALIEGMREVAKVNKASVVELDALSAGFQALKIFLAGGGEDTETFLRSLRNVRIDAGIAQAGITNYNQSLAETARLARLAEDANKEIFAENQFDAETRRLQRFEADAVASINAIGDAYKLLGVNADKVNADFIGAFDTLVNAAESTGKDINAAFGKIQGSIDTVEALEKVSASLWKAAEDGKITYAKAAEQVDKASESFLKNTGFVVENAKELNKQADAAKRAEENAAKMALELEKLASNERIKLIEARVELNVAQLQEDTKRIEAMFESINTTIDSTAEVIGDALSALKGFNSEFDPGFQIIKQQLDLENKRRQEALDLQKKMSEAQIELIREQIRALNNGDVLIKVDGAGLQPQLEAFMFEILKGIQVRLNQQGMKALLGVP